MLAVVELFLVMFLILLGVFLFLPFRDGGLATLPKLVSPNFYFFEEMGPSPGWGGLPICT